ncbi:hypothetical protein L1887_29282 [Cichorium endivia]|nr:hypothetical protein L1887_29282 [Cichorium endivia]
MCYGAVEVSKILPKSPSVFCDHAPRGLVLSSLAFHLHWNLIYPITVGHSVRCSSLILSQQEKNEEISSFFAVSF